MFSSRRVALVGALALSLSWVTSASAQRVSIRSTDPAKVELSGAGAEAVVTVIGAGVETLTSGYVEVARRRVGEIAVRVSPVRRGEARVVLVAERGVAPLRGVLVLSNRTGPVRISGLEVSVVAVPPRLLGVAPSVEAVEPGEEFTVRVSLDRDVSRDTRVELRYDGALVGSRTVVVPRGDRGAATVATAEPVSAATEAVITATLDRTMVRATVLVTAPPGFDPVVFTTPVLQAIGSLFDPVVFTTTSLHATGTPAAVFDPVVFTTTTLSARGDVFAPVQFTTPMLSARGTTFLPVRFTTPTLRARGNGGNQP